VVVREVIQVSRPISAKALAGLKSTLEAAR
jgi:hypothetical protein